MRTQILQAKKSVNIAIWYQNILHGKLSPLFLMVSYAIVTLDLIHVHPSWLLLATFSKDPKNKGEFRLCGWAPLHTRCLHYRKRTLSFENLNSLQCTASMSALCSGGKHYLHLPKASCYTNILGNIVWNKGPSVPLHTRNTRKIVPQQHVAKEAPGLSDNLSI